MGCGHSKINIYSKRTRNKNCSKKSVTPEKAENEDEEVADADAEANEKAEDADRKTIKVKPFGGPLLAHTELSSSQNNFFKMLDEKIENGPDYDSSSETERAFEQARLTTLLKDWETASSGSRSLPATPKRRPGREKPRNPELPRSADLPNRTMDQQPRIFNPHSQSAVHQSYGVTPYRQAYPPIYQNSPPHQPHQAPQYSSALQYQAISPMYTSASGYQPPMRQYHPQAYNPPPPQQGSPLKTYANANSPKHIPYEQPQPTYTSPNHKLYAAIPKSRLSNGDLIQQQIYQQQMQYQQAREFQQYKQTREHQLLQQQQQQGYTATRSYQSTVHIPIVMPNTQTDITHREQYELT